MKITDLKYTRLVLDASVLIKPFILESGYELVENIFEMHLKKELGIIAPTLLSFEIGNILRKRLDPAGRKSVFNKIKQLDLAEVPITSTEEKKIFSIIEAHPSATFYDASYHALAKSFAATFITADEKYYEIAKAEGHIMLLSQLN